VQNITTAIADFETGGLKHQFVAGLDLSFEAAERANSSATNAGTFPRPSTDAYNPSPAWANPVYVITNERESESNTAAIFASEQVWVTEELSFLFGVRADRYEIESDLTTFGAVNATTGVFTPTSPATVARTELSETLVSPRASAIWEPSEHSLVYLSWARSAQPATGTAIASVGTPITAGQEDLEPTTSETIEFGARHGFFDGDLTLGVSIFETTRDNSKETDPTTGGIIASGDEQSVRGVEFSVSGEITQDWVVTASYTYLDTETELATAACVATVGSPLQCPTGVTVGSAVPNPNAIGKPIPFAAEHAATLWTTYTPTDRLTLGLGARYTDEVWLNNTNTSIAPEYISVDGLVSYEISDTLLLSVNGANLLDREDNYDQVVGGRATHAPGRTIVVGLSKSF
jgi:catecholate siderophore receptor